MATLPDIILFKHPQAEFAVSDTYDSLLWHDSAIPKPTEADIAAWGEELAQFLEDTQYLQDQLELIYEQGIEGWRAEIEKIRQKYPKPTSGGR
jgi:hypothetical protein